jgi:hypothetical protein
VRKRAIAGNMHQAQRLRYMREFIAGQSRLVKWNKHDKIRRAEQIGSALP